uniref:Si:dkey-60a16.1 n=1 Tax=Paramormyrops kingsleyae TaxID=1676925 RepID=A0A3B3RDS7_9TELE
HCCVPLCTNSSRYNSILSFHSFPKDASVRAEWKVKVRRDDFSPNKTSRVCSRHFKKDDFINKPGKLRRLKKGAVPALFSWNNFQIPALRASVWERRPRAESPPPPVHDIGSEEEMEVATLAPDRDYCLSRTTARVAGQLAEENDALREKVKELELQIQALQLSSCFGLRRFAGSDEDIRFYTFHSYDHLMAFWRLIEPAPIDELFPFLKYLTTGCTQRELGHQFNIHRTTASRIITTWANFLYCVLGAVCIWIKPEEITANLPSEFKDYADTQVIVDCTELWCQTPSSLVLQSEVYSHYKSHCTFKAMIGMAPHGPLTFVSALYAGSISDRELFKLSGIIPLLSPNMAVMVDKGFRVDNLVPGKLHRPAFRFNKEQMAAHDVLETQSIVRLRVHIERLIRRVKENKLFDTVIPLSISGSINQLFTVACILSNYQNGP